jgi:hypothetical protein
LDEWDKSNEINIILSCTVPSGVIQRHLLVAAPGGRKKPTPEKIIDTNRKQGVYSRLKTYYFVGMFSKNTSAATMERFP